MTNVIQATDLFTKRIKLIEYGVRNGYKSPKIWADWKMRGLRNK